MPLRCYVVKIGGCFLTNKNGSYELNPDNVRLLASAVHKNLPNLSHPLIIVLGGGSFLNLAPKDYCLSPSENWKSCDLPMLAVTSFELLRQIIHIFRLENVSVFPFQTSAIIDIVDNEINVNCNAIFQALRVGTIPLLCGDLVFDDQNTFQIFSSDNIPVALSQIFDVIKVLYYTNVPGIYPLQRDQGIIENIHCEMFEQVLSAAGPSEQNDFTGGMKHKFSQIIKLAQKGIESEVLSYTCLDNLSVSLETEQRYGTKIRASRKVC